MELLADGYGLLQGFRAEWGRVVDMFLVVLAIGIVNLAIRFALIVLARRVERTDGIWDNALYYSLSGPLRAAVWIVGLSFAARIGDPPGDSLLAEVMPYARVLAWTGVAVWFLLRLITEVEKNILRRTIAAGKNVDQTTADAVAKLLRATVVITAVLVAMQSLGVSISGVLAFGGVGGIALGFAARDVIANFLGGLTIYLNRPFSVGDWIRSPDQDIEGVVEAVGWRATTVRRFDKRPLYVPNAVFTTVALENPSRMTHRRIFETVGVRYNDAAAMVPILADIRKMLAEHEEIDGNELIMVHFNQFGASSLDFFIYCYTVTRQWAHYHKVKEDILVRCHDIIAEHGAQVAFPTTTVHVPSGLHVLGEGAGGGAGPDESVVSDQRGGANSNA